MPGCRLRVRPAGAPVPLGHDRRGVGGARSAGAGGDGRVAAWPGRTSDEPPAAGGGGRDPLPGPLRGGMAGAAGGFPALAGGVRVLRTVGRPGSAPAGGRPAAGAAAGGRRPRRTADRGGDRLPVGQGRGHGRGRDQRIRWRKKIKGRKRHVAVDSNGGCWPCWSPRPACRTATAATASGAAAGRFSTITLGGRRRVRRAAGRLGAAVLAMSVTSSSAATTWAGSSCLQVGGGTYFGWLNRHRRLVRDYERLPEHHEAMVLWATTMIMTRQLVRQRSGNRPARAGALNAAKPQPQPKDHKRHDTVHQQALGRAQCAGRYTHGGRGARRRGPGTGPGSLPGSKGRGRDRVTEPARTPCRPFVADEDFGSWS